MVLVTRFERKPSLLAMDGSLMEHQSGSNPPAVLYPQLESTIAPLDENEKYNEIGKIERDLIKALINQAYDISQIEESNLIPKELTARVTSSKKVKIKEDLTKRMPVNDDVEDEDQAEDEEVTNEEVTDEEALVDDEDDDAGGDYAVSHFDNGEGFEDNDDEGEDMASTM